MLRRVFLDSAVGEALQHLPLATKVALPRIRPKEWAVWAVCDPCAILLKFCCRHHRQAAAARVRDDGCGLFHSCPSLAPFILADLYSAMAVSSSRSSSPLSTPNGGGGDGVGGTTATATIGMHPSSVLVLVLLSFDTLEFRDPRPTRDSS
mmetsp:Transcript_41356/g.83468  ORF Transcript_41356/g.83468 Transcript_41356/m.83468 type:complete len:150 (-) Transcript_41356:634-1083(-)